MALEHGPLGCPHSRRSCALAAPTGEVGAAATRASVAPRTTALPTLHHAYELLSRSENQAPLAGCTATETALLMQVAHWAHAYLTNPHPELGRSGQVCPYVNASIREHGFLLTLFHDATAKQREAEETMRRLAHHFLQLEPTEGRLAQRKTIVVLFPDLPASQAGSIIDDMHRRLKPDFLRHGLMLGEFHRWSSKPGLHNPEFRPLRSDIPLLVIRAMVPSDIAFLCDDARFVRAFLDNFGPRGHDELVRYLDREQKSIGSSERALLFELLEQAEGRGGPGRDFSDACTARPA